MEEVKSRALDGIKALSRKLMADEDEASLVEDEDRFEVSFSLSEPLGLELEERAHKLWVRRVIAGGAAAAAGNIVPGDILEIAGKVEATSMAALEEGLSAERGAGRFKATLKFGRPPDTEEALRKRVDRLQTLLAEERATTEALRHVVREEEEETTSRAVGPDPALETVRSERDSLRSELADVKRAAQREKVQADASAAQVQRSHEAEVARLNRREADLEAALVQQKQQMRFIDDGESDRVSMLEDELKRAREGLESQRRAASAAVLAAKRSGADKLEKVKAEKAELERRLQEATRPAAAAARVQKEDDRGELERKLARAQEAAKAATKSAMESRRALDDSNAERSALKARLNAAYEKANKADEEQLAREKRSGRGQRISSRRRMPTNREEDDEEMGVKAMRRHSKDELRALCGKSPTAGRRAATALLWIADAVDDLGFFCASLLRRSFSVRVSVLVYLLLLHAWTILLFVSRTLALSV